MHRIKKKFIEPYTDFLKSMMGDIIQVLCLLILQAIVLLLLVKIIRTYYQHCAFILSGFPFFS